MMVKNASRIDHEPPSGTNASGTRRAKPSGPAHRSAMGTNHHARRKTPRVAEVTLVSP
jgi:hypothetical protein